MAEQGVERWLGSSRLCSAVTPADKIEWPRTLLPASELLCGLIAGHEGNHWDGDTAW